MCNLQHMLLNYERKTVSYLHLILPAHTPHTHSLCVHNSDKNKNWRESSSMAH